jgi:hypothetical protein
VKSATIVSPYNEYDDVITFEVVAVENYGYYLFVPFYLYLKGTVIADKYKSKVLNINKKFLDEQIIYIDTNLVYRVNNILDGMICCKCQEFYPMSGPNQPDGETLLCYSCKQNPWH